MLDPADPPAFAPAFPVEPPVPRPPEPLVPAGPPEVPPAPPLERLENETSLPQPVLVTIQATAKTESG
jgi:hypothetical protein